jgi:hypothetical protein
MDIFQPDIGIIHGIGSRSEDGTEQQGKQAQFRAHYIIQKSMGQDGNFRRPSPWKKPDRPPITQQ